MPGRREKESLLLLLSLSLLSLPAQITDVKNMYLLCTVIHSVNTYIFIKRVNREIASLTLLEMGKQTAPWDTKSLLQLTSQSGPFRSHDHD